MPSHATPTKRIIILLYDTNMYLSILYNTFLYNKSMEISFKRNKIAEYRKMQNLSQRALARIIGTSQANLSRWEQGIVEPSIIECWKLADYFDISIDELCGRKDY